MYKIGKQKIFIIVISAIISITVCSKSSPIYPFNDWADANCFFTIGKSMLCGLVPYRDLFDHKGPVLYMVHALAALISWKTFLGVYFLEIIAAAIFLLFSYKLMQLYRETISILYIPVLSALVYSTLGFCHGDSVEELCLPFLAYAFYVGIRVLHNKQSITARESFFIGVSFACVFWMKFNLLGFYFGWICVLIGLFIRGYKFKELSRILMWILAGVLTLTFPIIIYFAVHHAIKDLFTVYFYDNVFLYANISSNNNYYYAKSW